MGVLDLHQPFRMLALGRASAVATAPARSKESNKAVNAVISLVLSGTLSWLTARPAAVTADRR
ncbi:hypothetical protein GCM10018773_62870 [Streptomyces candidus]|nr:hypothetical protein GCM10018773_62870 [Streptomyces candidus]